MSVAAILLPVFVLVFLAFALLLLLGGRRKAALAAGEVDLEQAPLDDRAWPASVRQASNAFRNQFELPVLFYAVVTLALVTRKADIGFVVLSWIFVLSRFGQAFVHVTSNDVRWRFLSFVIGFGALVLMWVLFALAILLAPVIP
ncbi:MAPEG family protein [Ancylobacter sp. A5.8]|uniref:MAPEG family protein n=1 Tax=Ancylobacter gelatini TaxID=2919920 RepID=UPI001F4E29BD|nr:MAPEG family protein [Ancylobacter gelatini]